MNTPTITTENIEMKTIYIRFKGSYIDFRKNSRKMFNQLFKFAESRNLIIPDVTKVLTIYHDNPYITDNNNLRTSVAMTVPESAIIDTDGEISSMIISGKYAVFHFDINRNEYQEAWEYIYKDWAKTTNMKLRDSFPFELYVTEPPMNSKEKSLTDIYIPIE